MIVKNRTNGDILYDGPSVADAVARRVSLSWTDLSKAKLRMADLRMADLRMADMSRADLSGADLRRANLSGTNLSRAKLSGANLSWTDLSWATLSVANLCMADMSESDMRRANLCGANLSGANLSGTCLDPGNAPNGGIGEWEDAGDGHVYGYRTRSQVVMGGDDYLDGQEYIAPWFSTCPHTECHPGLYINPQPGAENEIRVRLLRADLHSVGSKHRCKRFVVIGEAHKAATGGGEE